MKALSFASHAGAAPRERLTGGVAYTAGVLVMFAILGGVLLALKAGGSAIGWGFQLQSPQFVTVLIYVLFIAGLNLSGVFEFSGRFAGAGTSLAARSGVSGSFFTGALAAVVATPCTAPFMATAVGVALTQSAAVAMSAMLTLGLGLALPYFALTAFPAAARILPKPGAWMGTLKQALAFPLYASAAWLVWVVAQQASVDSVLLVLVGLVVLAFGLWMLGLPVRDGRRRLLRNAGVAAVLLSSLGLAARIAPAPSVALATPAAQEHSSQPYDAAKLASLRSAGKPVFVNMTAAWCITCKVNERVALAGDAFRDALTAGGFTYLKGDWTNQDPEITRLLETFGRAGVPLYVVFPANGGEAIVLPQLLTESVVVNALKTSGLVDSSNT
jgi:thiol:disulfide interchange protein